MSGVPTPPLSGLTTKKTFFISIFPSALSEETLLFIALSLKILKIQGGVFKWKSYSYINQTIISHCIHRFYLQCATSCIICALNFKEIINGFLFSRNFIETFLKKGSFNTGGSFSTSRQLKSVILFLFDFLKSSCLGENDSHLCLVYGKVY